MNKTNNDYESALGAVATDDANFPHAYIYGKEHPDLAAVLERPFVAMAGTLNKQGDYNNTKDGKWKRVELPLIEWIKGDKETWGLAVHPESKSKYGSALVFGEAADGARTDKAIIAQHAVVLDVDSGAVLEDVIVKIEQLGLFAIVYTSYNCGKTELVLQREQVMKKLGLDASPNLAQVQDYLRQHHKDNFESDFIAACDIVEERHTSNGLEIVLRTPPLDKFRVVFPLAEKVVLSDLAATLQQWKEVWADAVCGMAVNHLECDFDATSCDINRLHFAPRHAKGDDNWMSAVILGKPLKFEDIQPYSKAKFLKDRVPVGDPFTAGTSDDVDQYTTPSGVSLNEWHRTHKSRFMLSDVLETHCADKERNAGGERAGTMHVECPFEAGHSSLGGTATLAMNPDVTDHGYWTIFCQHDSCKGRHKLEFIQEMLEQQWFDEDLLKDETFCLPPESDDAQTDGTPTKTLTADQIAQKIDDAGINADSTAEDVKSFMAIYADYEQGTHHRITDALAKPIRGAGVTLFGRKALDNIWKEFAQAKAEKVVLADAVKRENTPTPDYIPVEDATAADISKAAAAAKWLPSRYAYKDGWFGFHEFDGAVSKFLPLAREFEVVFCADGVKGSTRTNEVTIRYQHRTASLGIVESVFRLGDMYKDSGTIMGRLKNEGLDFNPSAPTDKVLALMRAVNSDREATYIQQSGWTEDRLAFVSPTGEVITNSKMLYVLEHNLRVSKAKAGTFQMAIDAARDALNGRNAKFFLPGFLLGGVGCLANYLDTEMAVILANEGKAKHGKSTALKAGVAWFAPATKDGLLITGDVTPTALEVMSVRATGCAFAPDEQGTSGMSAEDEQRALLMYAGRIGRARGTPDGGMRDVAGWNGAMGASTETGLLLKLEIEQNKHGTDIKAGALSRVFTVNFDGAHSLSRDKDAAELDAYKVLAHGGTCGWFGPAFAAELLRLGVDVVNERVSALESEWGADHSGAASRVVTTAALFGVVAQIMQEAGHLPNEVDLMGTLKTLMDETIEARSHHLDTEVQATNALRRNIIKAVNEQHIIAVGDEGRGQSIFGYYTEGKGDALDERVYVLPKDRLGELGVKTDDPALVQMLRDEDGLVEPRAESGKGFKRGMWDSIPNEGKGLNIRVSGEWVHGEMVTDD